MEKFEELRRVDDLGRVAIPKAVRAKLSIKEGQPMEVFFDGGLGIVQFATSLPDQPPFANDWFAETRWHVDDIIEIAADKGVTLTPEQAANWWKKNERWFTERLTELGNEILSNANFDATEL